MNSRKLRMEIRVMTHQIIKMNSRLTRLIQERSKLLKVLENNNGR